MAVRVLDGDGAGEHPGHRERHRLRGEQRRGRYQPEPRGLAAAAATWRCRMRSRWPSSGSRGRGRGRQRQTTASATTTTPSPSPPARFGTPNLICVAAVTRTGARSGFSNFGSTHGGSGRAGRRRQRRPRRGRPEREAVMGGAPVQRGLPDRQRRVGRLARVRPGLGPRRQRTRRRVGHGQPVGELPAGHRLDLRANLGRLARGAGRLPHRLLAAAGERGQPRLRRRGRDDR